MAPKGAMPRLSATGGVLVPEKPVRLWSCTWTAADQVAPPSVDRVYHIRSSVQVLAPQASDSQATCTVPFFCTAISQPRSMPPTGAVGRSTSVQFTPLFEEKANFSLLARSQQV